MDLSQEDDLMLAPLPETIQRPHSGQEEEEESGKLIEKRSLNNEQKKVTIAKKKNEYEPKDLKKKGRKGGNPRRIKDYLPVNEIIAEGHNPSLVKEKNTYILPIVSLMFLFAAFSFSYYVRTLKQAHIQQQNEEQLKRQRDHIKYEGKYLKQLSSIKKRGHRQNSIHLSPSNQQQLKSLFQQLSKQSCPQLIYPPEQIQLQDSLKLEESMARQKKNIVQVSEKKNDLDQSNEGLKIADKQDQQLRKQQEESIKAEKFIQSIQAGTSILPSQLEKAKRYKSLVQDIWKESDISKQQYQYYEKAYNISHYQQLPFCVVVPTFNNEENARYQLNLDSIVQQNYSNYHIVIIQDASTDQTPKLIDEHVSFLIKQSTKLGKKLQIQVIHNKEQRRAMPNLRKAAFQNCKPQEIFVIVDGDDQLIGRQVFKLFNSRFQEKKSWFVYSNFMSFVGNLGYSRRFKQEIINQNRYRKANFVTSHLRAFYTQLFRLVKQEDLKDSSGQYLRAANDVAICLPILEMSHRRVTYIPEITYLYNSNTGLNNHLVRLREQIDNTKMIRKRPSYEALKQLKFI